MFLSVLYHQGLEQSMQQTLNSSWLPEVTDPWFGPSAPIWNKSFIQIS